MYGACAVFEGDGIAGLIDEADRYKCEGNIRGVWNILKGNIGEPTAIGYAYGQVTSTDGVKGMLIFSVYWHWHYGHIVDQCISVGGHMSHCSRVAEL